jgi:HD domain
MSFPAERLKMVEASVVPEGRVEQQIVFDEEWIEGAAWGDPRPGHPEGIVAGHIAEVLENIERIALDGEDRQRLRFVALIHDTFKHRVDRERARTGDNHHATIARRFAEKYTDDDELLKVVELHDEAYNSWIKGERGGKWEAAEQRARRLVDRLGSSLGLYLRFYRADNTTGSKSQEPLQWFEQLVSPHLPDS